MKTIIALFNIALATNSFAVTVNSSWESIKASRNVVAKAPTVAFDAGAATTFISVLDLCANSEEVQTIEKQNVYKHVMLNNRNAIEVIGTKNLTHPITYTHTVFRKSPGSSSSVEVEVTETIAIDYNVDVVEKLLGSSREGRKLFVKEFSIPACK